MISHLKKIGLCLLVAVTLAYGLPALASETTGTVSTGVESGGGVGGTVITTPSASPDAGTYSGAQSITLVASGSSSINYTIDGTTPTCSSGSTYSGSILISSSTTIKAISCYPDSVSSSEADFSYTINSSGGGGGGGGGGGYYGTPTVATTTVTTPTTTDNSTLIAQLQAELAALEAQLAALEAGSTGTTSGSTTFTIFTKNLWPNTADPDVKRLQQWLNAHGFPVSLTGAGSVGHENNNYGAKTEAAVAKFQEAHSAGILVPGGFTSGTGIFATYTRNFVNNMILAGQ